MRKSWVGRVIVVSLLLGHPLFFPSRAQDTTTGTAAPNLAELKLHRETWPLRLKLKVPIRLTIVLNGREVGAITSPAGSTVDLLSVEDSSLQIGVGAARATVNAGQTDLAECLVLATPSSSPPPVPATAPPLTTPLVSASPSPPVTPIPAPTAADGPPPVPAGSPLLLDEEMPPRDNFTKAAFRFWSPSYGQPIRGLIILVPGLNGDGRGMIDAPPWRDLAMRHRLGLVGCFLQGRDYYNAMRGTGDALLTALKDFAGQAGHPEIAQVPLLLYGESAGGQFDYDFALWKPERLMAFVVNKGGYYASGEPDSHTCATPGLFFLGLKDTDLRIHAITGIWTEGRKKGALWALAPQPNSGHEFSKTAAMARVFFEAVLKSRLPEENSLGGDPSPMKPMPESQGWLGDMTTHEVRDGSTDSETHREASWLPDESTALAWKAFVSAEN